MPIIDYNSQLYTEWINSDMRQLGAQLNPLGEMHIFDFFMEVSGDIAKQRSRLSGVQAEIVMFVMSFCIFGRNLAITSKMTIQRPRNMISWCCLIPSVLGIVSNLVAVFMSIGFPIGCRLMTWLISLSMSLTMISNSLILLQKVYLALCRQTWIIYISAPSIIAQLAYAFIIMYCSFTSLEEKVGCMNYYPSYLIWFWFSVNVPINVLFSSAFCYIALKQYRVFGSEAWKNLARDGIQTMALATLCSIFCSVLIVTPMTKINNDMFLAIDWLVVTTILINHCKNIGKNVSTAHRPKTSHMLNLSQIATAKSIN